MKKEKPDYILLIIVALIIVFGLFILAGTAPIGSGSRFMMQIGVGFLPGILIGFALYKLPISKIQKWAPYPFFINLSFLVLLLLPFFRGEMRGSNRWLNLGGFSFQPTELLKLTFVLYISSWLIAKIQEQKKHSNFSNIVFLIFVGICGLIAFLLYCQPDLSTMIIILATAGVVYFVAKTPLWHFFALIVIGIVVFGSFLALKPYQLERVKSIFSSDTNLQDENYQANQFRIAVGSGGLLGQGIGMSKQKFGWLSFPASDSIYAVLGEETGFIGSIMLLFLFFAFFWRGLLIAKNNTNGFARLVAIGICSWIFGQALVNMGVVVGIFPVTGIPLPLISYGKSHLITELMAIGILLNTSQYVRK
jgi:cell division protein FtsW